MAHTSMARRVNSYRTRELAAALVGMYGARAAREYTATAPEAGPDAETLARVWRRHRPERDSMVWDVLTPAEVRLNFEAGAVDVLERR